MIGNSPLRAESTNGDLHSPAVVREQHKAETYLQHNGLSPSDPLVMTPRTLDLVMFGIQQQHLPPGAGTTIEHYSLRAESANGGLQAPEVAHEQHQAGVFLEQNGLSPSDAFAICSVLGARTVHDLSLQKDATRKVASATDLQPIQLQIPGGIPEFF